MSVLFHKYNNLETALNHMNRNSGLALEAMYSHNLCSHIPIKNFLHSETTRTNGTCTHVTQFQCGEARVVRAPVIDLHGGCQKFYTLQDVIQGGLRCKIFFTFKIYN